MSSEKALQPNLTEIVNMNLCKKDLMEMVEVEIEEELTKTLELIRKKHDDLVKKKESLYKRLTEHEEKCNERTVNKLKKGIEKRIQTLGLNPEHFIFRKKVQWSSETKFEDIILSDTTFLHSPCHRFRIIKVIDGKISGSIQAYFADNEGLNVGLTSKTIKKKPDKRYLDKRDELIEEIRQNQEAIITAAKEISEVRRNISNLPKKLKIFSAEISRQALSSSDKGKKVLNLLTSIKKQNKKQIEGK